MRPTGIVLLVGLLLGGAALDAGAQPAPDPMKTSMDRAPDRAMAAPDKGGMWTSYDYGKARSKKDEIPSGTLVVVAYLVLWAVLVGYVVVLALRQRRLRDDLAELQRELRRRDGNHEVSKESQA